MPAPGVPQPGAWVPPRPRPYRLSWGLGEPDALMTFIPSRVTEAIAEHHDAETGASPGDLTMLVALADLDEALGMRAPLVETLQAIA